MEKVGLVKERQSEFMLFLGELRLYDCNWQCLTDCPSPGDCYWDDPNIGEPIEYPEHTFWRWDNEELVRPEPEDPTQIRCPRCFSTKVVVGYPYIKCLNCEYGEPLIDFPISRHYHLAMLKGLGKE